jgi:hypothetical protein
MYKKAWNEISTEEEIAEACEDAAELLEGHWTTGAWFSSWDEYDEQGSEVERWSYCIEGAMAAAIGLDAADMEANSDQRGKLLTCPVYSAVLDTLNQRAKREDWDERWGMGDLPGWNDNGWGSEQNALDLLHETAKRMRGVAPDA